MGARLEVLWRTPLAGREPIRHAPIVDGDAVLARRGDVVARVELDDGRVAWRCAIGPAAGAGTVLVRGADRVVVEARRRRDDLSTLVAVHVRRGEVDWQTDLPGLVTDDAATIVGGELFAATVVPGRGGRIFRLDGASGRILAEHLPQAAVAELVPSGGRFLARSHTARREAAGLSVMEPDGTGAVPLAAGACWFAALAGGTVVSLSRPIEALDREPGALEGRDATTLERRWRVEVDGRTATHDGSDVYAADGDCVVRRDAASGRLVWRSAPLVERALALAVAGPIVLAYGLRQPSIIARRDGALLGTAPADLSPPAVIRDRLVAGDTDGLVCADLTRFR